MHSGALELEEMKMLSGRAVRIMEVPPSYLGDGDPKRAEWFVLEAGTRIVVDWFDDRHKAEMWCQINGLDVIEINELALN
jgi:hypothetical protein